jgi:hypothetical protein
MLRQTPQLPGWAVHSWQFDHPPFNTRNRTQKGEEFDGFELRRSNDLCRRCFGTRLNFATPDESAAAVRRIAMCQGFEIDQPRQGILEILR